MFLRISDPALELGAARDRAGGIVGKAKVYNIGLLVRRARDETVFRAARQVDQSFVAARLIRRPGVSRHHVRIDVNRINWVGNRDPVSVAKHVQNKSAVAFRSVGNKDFIIRNLHSAGAIIELRDFAPQKIAALLVAITTKGFAHR